MTVGAIAVLYFAKSVFIPISLGILLSFVLGPLVEIVERLRIGRVAAVICVLAICSIALTLMIWVLGAQSIELSNNLRQYESNIERRVEQLRALIPTGLEKAKDVIEKIEQQVLNPDEKADEGIDEADGTDETAGDTESSNRKPAEAGKLKSGNPISQTPLETGKSNNDELKPEQPPVAEPVKVAVVADSTNPFAMVIGLVNPVLAPMATAGIVIVLAIFILLDEGDFRKRLIRLFDSGGDDSVETAFLEASERSMTWLRTMFLINAIYGVAVAIGLYAFGLPNAPLWGFIAFSCRFVPYVGPWIGAAIPILLSLGVFEGWGRLLGIGAMYVVYELCVNLVLEPLLYGRSLGLTSLGIIIAAIFWTWIWGPAGLVIAVPMTLWLVVLGKYIPHFSQFTILFGDSSESSSRS